MATAELPTVATRTSSSSTTIISEPASSKSLPPLSSLLQSIGQSVSAPTSPTKRGSTDLLINKLKSASYSGSSASDATTTSTSLSQQTALPLPPALTSSLSPSSSSSSSHALDPLYRTPARPVSFLPNSSNSSPSGPPTGVFKDKSSPATGNKLLQTAEKKKQSFSFISHSPATFPIQDSNSEDGSTGRRKRRRTSPAELAMLKSEYEIGNTPNKARRTEIATRLGMTEKAVQIWFQNRRQSMRRKSHNDPDIVVEIPEIPAASAAAPSSSTTFQMSHTPRIEVASPTTSPEKSEESSPIRVTRIDDSPSSSFYGQTPQTMQHSSSPDRHASFKVTGVTHTLNLSSPNVPMMPPRATWAPSMITTPSRSKHENPNNVTPVRSSYPSSSAQGSTMTFRLGNSTKKTAGLLTPLESTTRKNKRPTWKVNASAALGHKEISTSVFASVDTPSKTKKAKLFVQEENTFNIYHDKDQKSVTSSLKSSNALQVKDENVKVVTEAKEKPDTSDIECVENLLALRAAPSRRAN
ncbi:unnamed protein product [Kuraishia capsulata CBS 1993]|uniref:Homeobox domain-containing protein n=1 Tax=Kuraishia capsulata CBS 1993 TaxID=1382522 RepID=W6MGA2_9ASCO|nr:uncharacterized protein KUCA_T00000773001 [Kuraishia capsulata CBS 1993]CDK24806.1 unnamed protein product [Kuraishia capsulata CBS 1993]